MTHVHYKFSSRLSYDTVVFDGPHITLLELKRLIMCREKLRAADCDLLITDAQSKQEYTDDEGHISKGSSVIVRRIPISGGKSGTSSKTHNIERSVSQHHHTFEVAKAMDGQTSSSTLHFFSKMANLADADVSEEDKIKVVLNQSTYDPMTYNKKFGTALPANYTCYRCGNGGHHIRNCPTSGLDKNFEAPQRIKKSTGIPRSFMVEVDDPNMKGAMLTNCGRYAIPTIDAQAYAIGKKEKPPFVPQEKPKSKVTEDPVPDELVCLICRELLSDAVVIPCCGNSYCDDCIRTTLLDSEEHVCPTCDQSNVSPDTLIANKFLRQAVNNFKKERGFNKSLTKGSGNSQPQNQNPTPMPSPVRTPPPLMVQSQLQRPPQTTCSQQAADPPAATGPTSACNVLIPSQQTEESCLEIPDKDAGGETVDDLAADADADVASPAPSAQVSNSDITAAPSQLIPLVTDTTVAEQPQTESVSKQSSSGCLTGSWTESQQITPPPASAYSGTTTPLFPAPHLHTYLSANQSHSNYPPGYLPTTPIWTLPCPQGAPIPSLCPPTSTSSIPALVPKKCYKHQRKNVERSPHTGSTYRRSSSSCSNSKSSKHKSSRSYSRSSSRSRSRSRSRSHSRSRPHSPYSRHRSLHIRSLPSYTYGYKRSHSPTPSSSSSPQDGHHSRSKSSSDYQKNSHHSHHPTRKSLSSSYCSLRQGESLGREGRVSSTSSQYAQHANQSSSLELDSERFLEWKKQYNEWYEKYFSSYVGHFQQIPHPFINFPPPPPLWEARHHSQANSHSQYRKDGGSPSSYSSRDSRSPLSHSSSDSCSTPSQSSSDSRSSPSHTYNSHSSPSHSSSDGHSTPSEDRTEPRAYQQQQGSQLPVTLTKSSKEVKEQERSSISKQVIIKNLEEQRVKTLKDGREEESSSSDDTDSTDRKDPRRHNTGPHANKHDTSVRDEAASLPSLKPGESFDKDSESKSKEKRSLKRKKDSDSSRDKERQHKLKSSNESDRRASDRDRKPGGSKTSDLSSEKNRKRKGEYQAKEESCNTELPNASDRKKPKDEQRKESKTWPVRDGDIWEGGITVKPQKKISININLDGRRKEEKTEKEEGITGKSKEDIENIGDGGETFNRKDSDVGRVKAGVVEENTKPGEGEAGEFEEKAAIRDDKQEMWGNITGEKEDVGEKKEDGEVEDIDLWHCAIRGVKEEKKRKNQSKEVVWIKISEEDLTGKEEEKESEIGGLVQTSGKERAKGESTCEEDRGNLQVKGQDSPPVVLSQPTETATRRETEQENEQKIERRTDAEKEKSFSLSGLRGRLAPSSGKDTTDSALCSGRETAMERSGGRERERHRQRPRDGQKDAKRLKEDNSARDRGREKRHGSAGSVQKTNPPGVSHFYTYSTSQDTDRKDKHRGDHHRRHGRSSNSSQLSASGHRAAGVSDKHAHITYRDTLLDLKCKDRNHPDDYRNRGDPAGKRLSDRSAGTHHSSPSHPHGHGKQREPQVSESCSPKPSQTRGSSPGRSKEERVEWKRRKVHKEMRGERETRGVEAETERDSQWKDDGDKLGEFKWEGPRQLQEGERLGSSISIGSPSGHDSSRDDRMKESNKNQKKEKGGKWQSSWEPQEDWRL